MLGEFLIAKGQSKTLLAVTSLVLVLLGVGIVLLFA